MIAFITWNSDLVSLIEDLCSSNPCGFEFWDCGVFAGIEPTTFGTDLIKKQELVERKNRTTKIRKIWLAAAASQKSGNFLEDTSTKEVADLSEKIRKISTCDGHWSENELHKNREKFIWEYR